MKSVSSPNQVERFRNMIAGTIGLQFDDSKLGFLAEVLERRLHKEKTADAYLDELEARKLPDEAGALALELTVPETYFFRNIEQFHALAELVIPDSMGAPGSRKSLRILSAGCASGEEPYTIAMLTRELQAEVSIRAVDLNRAMLDRAARGRYTEWALRETPPEMRNKWFQRSGTESVLDETIRKAVQFSQRNLADADAGLWGVEQYEIVFCRNVLMYLTHEKAAAVLSRITGALSPGGYLFLGHAENLRGLSQDFHLHHTHGTFYYQRRDRRPAPGPAGTQSARADATALPLVAPVDGTGSWVEVIRNASERVRAITQQPASPAAAPWPAGGLEAALELLHQEQFGEALELMRALPLEATRSSEAMLLTAVLLTHGGQLADAEAACRKLMEVDELNAGAHYVMALCRESAADTGGATDHDQTAIYLDPAFAMPHMHLGLLARRAGDLESARRELSQALVLLQREDGSRLLLFGGGFSRETLIALCRAELRASGGEP